MHFKIFLVGAILRRRIEAGRIVRQSALRVEDLDHAEMPGGGGMIEQDQVLDFLADAPDIGITRLLVTARSERSYSSMFRLTSASMPEARFSRVWRASCSSPRRMSSMTLVQIAVKPITVAIDDAINSFADNRQGRRPASVLNHPLLRPIALPSK